MMMMLSVLLMMTKMDNVNYQFLVEIYDYDEDDGDDDDEDDDDVDDDQKTFIINLQLKESEDITRDYIVTSTKRQVNLCHHHNHVYHCDHHHMHHNHIQY